MRLYPAVVSLALIGATLSPLARPVSDDAFPLSTYPMFATTRATTATVTYALAVGAGTVRHTIPPVLVGSGEPLQAMAIFERAVLYPAEALALCEQIAFRVSRDHDFDDATTLRIVTGTHDAVDYLVRDAIGHEAESVHCPVPR